VLDAQMTGDARFGDRVGGSDTNASRVGHGFPLSAALGVKSTHHGAVIHPRPGNLIGPSAR